MAPRGVDGMNCEAEFLVARLKKPNVGFGSVALSSRLIEVLMETGVHYAKLQQLSEAKHAFCRGIQLIDDPPIWFTLRESLMWKHRTDFISALASVNEKMGNITDARDGLTSAAQECLQRSAVLKQNGRERESSVPARNALILLDKKSKIAGARPQSARRDNKLLFTASKYTGHSPFPPVPVSRSPSFPLSPTLPKLPTSPLSPAPPVSNLHHPSARHKNRTPADIKQRITAAITIQATWRLCAARWLAAQRKRDYLMYKKQRSEWERTSLQRQLMQLTKQRPAQMPCHKRMSGREAARKIQSMWRMYVAVKAMSQLRVMYCHTLSAAHLQERLVIERREGAAAVIQKTMRMHLARCLFRRRTVQYKSYIRTLHRDPSNAATMIQAMVRGRLARKKATRRVSEYRNYRAAGAGDEAAHITSRLTAVLVIQKEYRRYAAVARYHNAKQIYLAEMKNRVACEMPMNENNAAIMIQRSIRGHLARRLHSRKMKAMEDRRDARLLREGRVSHDAAVAIQKQLRGHIARTCYGVRKQQYDYQTCERIQHEGALRDNAATRIQACMRRKLVYIVVQGRKKQYLDNKELRVLRERPDSVVLRLQSWLRACFARHLVSKRLLLYRLYITERDMRDRASLVIQCQWRMHSAILLVARRKEQYAEYIKRTTPDLRMCATVIQRTWRACGVRKRTTRRKEEYATYIKHLVKNEMNYYTSGVRPTVTGLYMQRAPLLEAVTVLQKCWRGVLVRRLAATRREQYSTQRTKRVNWEDDNVSSSRSFLLGLCHEQPSDTVYSEEWETKMWTGLQDGNLSLKEYLCRIRRVIGPPVVVDEPTSPSGGSFRRNRLNATEGANTPTNKSLMPRQPQAERPSTTPSRPARLDANAVRSRGIVPPSWLSASCGPRTPGGCLRWDASSLPVHADMSEEGTMLWKTSYRDAIVVSQQQLSGSFKLRWKLEMTNNKASPVETLVGVIPYGEPGSRLGLLYRHRDGCLKKQNTMRAVGMAQPSVYGDVMELSVDPVDGATLSRNSVVIWRQSVLEMRGSGIGRPEGKFLVCAVLYGVPGVCATLLPDTDDTALHSVALIIQRNWRAHRALQMATSLKRLYRSYLNHLHQWEARNPGQTRVSFHDLQHSHP
eukprot:TRINITY_DN1471_c0_g2_i2.p1 TRINITY_DN1471_c0_g2~~TRINITY_DN1471_c0_g2_i2.p1  ORF type:complete len:1126 (+),score=197.50 TRINITY_DN1471_c0_g2_i2:55-3432(+)